MRIEAYKPDQVDLRPVADGPLRGASPGSFGQDVAQATQGLGRAIGQVGEQAQQLADTQARTRAMEVDVEMSANIREELHGENGLLNLQGQRFVDEAPNYLKRIEEKAKALSTGRNAFEQDLIRQQVMQRLEAARSQIGGQVVRETQFANKAATTARALNQTENAAMSYRDPEAYRRERAMLDAALVEQLEAQGLADPASFQAARRDRYNDINTYAITDMIRRGETGQAQAWMDSALVKGELKPQAATILQERLEKATLENELGYLAEGQAPPSEVQGNMTSATPELVAAVTWQESRGNGMAVSPKGAAGVMQVMPTTGPEAARLAGLPWQPERMTSRDPKDIEYQGKLGQAYLNQQLKTFGGNVTAALAAYNAGPGMVQDWIDGTNKTGKNKGGLKLGDPNVNPRAWANAIPFAETKDYVAKITAKLGGTTKTPLPQNVKTVEQVEAFAAQFGDPKQRQAARAAGIAKMSQNRAAESQRQSDAWDAVQPYVQQDTPWTAIPKSLWNALDPQHQTALMDAQKKGLNRVTSPEALDLIYTTMERDPAGFKQMDLLRLAPDFSPSDFEQIRKAQSDARLGRGAWKQPAAQYTSVTRLAPTIAPPSLLAPARKVELAQFKSRWFQAVQLKQSSQTEPLTDDEVAEIGTRLTAETAVSGGAFGPKTRPLYQFAPNVDKNEATGYSSIPPAERDQVVRFLQQRSGTTPKVGEVLDTWRTLKATGDL